MREWMARLRCIRGVEWAAAAIAVGMVALLFLSGGENATREERRLRRILEKVDGAGQVDVMLHTCEEEGEMRIGVVIVAEGADSIRTNMELCRAVCALTGAQPENVEVIRMKKRSGGT